MSLSCVTALAGAPWVPLQYVCVYYCSTFDKVVRVGGGDSGGHVLRETTSRGLSGLVCPSRTSKRGGEGDCVKECVLCVFYYCRT